MSTFLLNAVSAHLLSDVSPLPMIWVLPLALFLLSYILGFSGKLDKLLGYFAVATIGFAAGAFFCMDLEPAKGLEANLFAAAGLILVGGTFIHGWLYQTRPEPSRLTAYYLWISIGGAVGGVFASIGAPLLLKSVLEYPISLCFVLLLSGSFLCSKANLETADWFSVFRTSHFKKAICFVTVAIAALGLYKALGERPERIVLQMRNFYGYSWVTSAKLSLESGRAFPMHSFYHGTTKHGFQIENEFYNQEPTSYFGRNGVGQAFNGYTNKPVRVAILGLGVGTISCYGKPGDYFRFYEINPDVAQIACDMNLFTYVSGSKAKVEIVVDDARRALERERAANEPLYDIIVLDVYNGDSIPLHLATKEAFRLYLDRLKPDGIVALHLTSWHLDLFPMAKAAGEMFNLNYCGVAAGAQEFSFSPLWAFMSPRTVELNKAQIREIDFPKVKNIPLMTDNRNSLLPYLSFNPSQPLKEIEFNLWGK